MFDAAQRTRGGPHVFGEAHHSTSEGSNGTSRATAVEAAGARPDLAGTGIRDPGRRRVRQPRGHGRDGLAATVHHQYPQVAVALGPLILPRAHPLPEPRCPPRPPELLDRPVHHVPPAPAPTPDQTPASKIDRFSSFAPTPTTRHPERRPRALLVTRWDRSTAGTRRPNGGQSTAHYTEGWFRDSACQRRHEDRKSVV